MRVLAVISSSVLAQLWDGRRTVHSALKIFNSAHFKSTYSTEANSQLLKELGRMKLIVWSEIELTHWHDINSVDRMLNDFVRSVAPLHGIMILYIRGFRQILPVVRD